MLVHPPWHGAPHGEVSPGPKFCGFPAPLRQHYAADSHGLQPLSVTLCPPCLKWACCSTGAALLLCADMLPRGLREKLLLAAQRIKKKHKEQLKEQRAAAAATA